MSRLLKDLTAQQELARKLDDLDAVKLHNSVDEPESWRIAHDLSEIEEAFCKIYTELIPQLMQESNQVIIQELLEDIGDQIRHAAYHMDNSVYLQSWSRNLPSGD